MKVTFYKNIKTMSGRCKQGSMVFISAKNHSVCLARNYVKPRYTENNELTGLKMKAAAFLWKSVSIGFIQDLKTYAAAYNHQHLDERTLYISAYNVFIMAVMKCSTPFASIAALVTAYGSTLEDWMVGGFLKRVNTTATFTETVS